MTSPHSGERVGAGFLGRENANRAIGRIEGFEPLPTTRQQVAKANPAIEDREAAEYQIGGDFWRLGGRINSRRLTPATVARY